MVFRHPMGTEDLSRLRGTLRICLEPLVIRRSQSLAREPGALPRENDTHVIRLDEEILGDHKVDTVSDWDQKAPQQVELEKGGYCFYATTLREGQTPLTAQCRVRIIQFLCSKAANCRRNSAIGGL